MHIYADHAATTPTSPAAVQAMLAAMKDTWGNPSSLHTVGQQAAEALAGARARIAARLGCAPQEVIFTSGGTEADNQALRSAACQGAARGKKHIISTAFEHHAVLHTLDKLAAEGFEITLLPVGEKGLVTPDQLRDALRPDTCLVSIMYANNEIGTIQPIREQAVGHLPINVAADNIDMLSLSAHKFGGPRGVGALYARKGLRVEPLLRGGAQERGRRAGTENLPGILGMAAALDEACGAMAEVTARLVPLRDELIAGLSQIPHGALNGDAVQRLPGNVSFCFEGIEGESLLLLLDDKGICASSGSACTSGSLDPSHVLLAIGRVHDVAHGSLRLTLGPDATREEVQYLINAVTDAVAYLRGISPVWRDLQSGVRPYILP